MSFAQAQADPMLDAMRETVKAVGALLPVASRIDLHPADYDALKEAAEMSTHAPTLYPTGVYVMLDHGLPMGRARVFYTDGTSKEIDLNG